MHVQTPSHWCVTTQAKSQEMFRDLPSNDQILVLSPELMQTNYTVLFASPSPMLSKCPVGLQGPAEALLKDKACEQYRLCVSLYRPPHQHLPLSPHLHNSSAQYEFVTVPFTGEGTKAQRGWTTSSG